MNMIFMILLVVFIVVRTGKDEEKPQLANKVVFDHFKGFNLETQIHNIKLYPENVLKCDKKLDILVREDTRFAGPSNFEVFMTKYFIFYKEAYGSGFYLSTMTASLVDEKRVQRLELPSDEKRMLKLLEYLSRIERYTLKIYYICYSAIPLMKQILRMHPHSLYLLGGCFSSDIFGILENQSFHELNLRIAEISTEQLKSFLNVKCIRKRICFRKMPINGCQILSLNRECESIEFFQADPFGIDPLEQCIIVQLPPDIGDVFRFVSNVPDILLSSQSSINVKRPDLITQTEILISKLLSSCTQLRNLTITVDCLLYNSIVFLMQDNLRETLETLAISIGSNYVFHQGKRREIEKFFGIPIKFATNLANTLDRGEQGSWYDPESNEN